MRDRPDEEIIARVLDGRPEAYRDLVERYQRPFLRYAQRMVSSPAVAADVVQDSFVKAYRELDRCEHPERFAAWCFQIVRNRCHDHLRGPEQQRSAGSEPLESMPTERSDPAVTAERSDLRLAIRRAVAELSPTLREAFVLYHESALTYPEMAERLGASASAVKMRVKRARDALRERLAAYEDHVPT